MITRENDAWPDREISGVFRRYLTDWRPRNLKSISKADVHKKISDIGRFNGHIAANHTITYARAAINWCITNGFYEGTNPWSNVSKFKTQARDRFLKPDEIGRFFAALRELDNTKGFRDYFYLSVFTGARRSNVFAMRWEEIDFDLGTWTIPRTKNGESQILPLTRSVLEILSKRHDSKTSEWVFPSERSTGHLVEPKKLGILCCEKPT